MWQNSQWLFDLLGSTFDKFGIFKNYYLKHYIIYIKL